MKNNWMIIVAVILLFVIILMVSYSLKGKDIKRKLRAQTYDDCVFKQQNKGISLYEAQKNCTGILN